MVSPLDSLGEKLAVQAAAASKRYAAQLKELGEMGSEPGGASTGINGLGVDEHIPYIFF